MLPAVRQSPTRDAALFQLYPPPVVARGLCKSPSSSKCAESARAEGLVCGARYSKFFCIEKSAGEVPPFWYVSIDTRKRTTVGRSHI